jgi:hypothetical protein
VSHTLKFHGHEGLHEMQDRNANPNAHRVDKKEHAQLMHEVARARVGIRPVTVEGEIAAYRTDEGEAPGVHQPHVEEMNQ